MGSLNKVMLIGRLGKDPEIRYTQSGSAVANFTIATSEYWTDQQGQRQEKTEWHNIVAWNKLADLTQSYLKQGSQIYLEGNLQTRSWDDAQSGQKRYKTEINARVIQFLDSRPSESSAGAGAYNSRPQNQPNAGPPSDNHSVSDSTARPSVQQNPSQNQSNPHEEAPVESYIEDDIPF
ncbi:MAG: single-stranded DNA-binding protein [SAR324 cluster bacterium]|nr:single-stranded DNA-binding protein [SAR324 cluster bacterium]